MRNPSSMTIGAGGSAALIIALQLSVACDRVPASSSATPAPQFAALVDEYLDQFARRHPSIAAGNGLHAYDGELEDFSAPAIAAEIDWLRGFRRRIDAVDPAALTPDERVDRRILQGVIDGWLLDLDTVRTWARNPMIYASAISDGVHNLMTMESSPAASRAKQATTKLTAVRRLLAAARENLRNPPRVFVSRAIVMFRGAADLMARDLPLAFADVADRAIQDDLAAAANDARKAIDVYTAELESKVLQNATDAYAIGTANVEARYRAEELIDVPAATLLAIGERELQRAQADFDATAGRVEPRRPGRSALEGWRHVLDDHPKRGELPAAAQKTVDELLAFIRERRLVDLPEGEHVVVAAAPAFDLGLASMHSSPPLEPHPVKSFYYVTDAQADWPAEQQNAWLQKFNYPTLADISAHEVAPGHYVHSLFMRRTPGKIRRIWIGLNPFPQPSSGQDGWAHYSEQMILDEHFGNDDPRLRLAQLSDALTRICRLLSGIRVHTKEWTLEQAQACFEQQAYVPAAAAKREAERASYDPTYGGYFLGKIALLKLRDDYAAQRGIGFTLREFHERIMSNGIAPVRAHRRLLLP